MGIGLEPRQERGPGLLKRATSPRTTAGRTFSEDNVGDCGIHVVGAGLGNECPRSCGGNSPEGRRRVTGSRRCCWCAWRSPRSASWPTLCLRWASPGGETRSLGIGGASETALRALQGFGQVNRMARGSHFYVDQKAVKMIYWPGMLEAGSA